MQGELMQCVWGVLWNEEILIFCYLLIALSAAALYQAGYSGAT